MSLSAVQNYTLTSPYGHFSITDSSFGPRNEKKPYLPYIYDTDTSLNRTLGSVPLVSVLKRIDCNMTHIIRLNLRHPLESHKGRLN